MCIRDRYHIKSGKKSYYAYSDEEKKKILNRLSSQKGQKKAVSQKKATKGFKIKQIGGQEQVDDEKITGVNIQRYKGLGEMNPDELFNTTMDPEKRILKKVEIMDAAKTDEIFEILMGKEVSSRKRFIQTRAQSVENLDV